MLSPALPPVAVGHGVGPGPFLTCVSPGSSVAGLASLTSRWSWARDTWPSVWMRTAPSVGRVESQSHLLCPYEPVVPELSQLGPQGEVAVDEEGLPTLLVEVLKGEAWEVQKEAATAVSSAAQPCAHSPEVACSWPRGR